MSLLEATNVTHLFDDDPQKRLILRDINLSVAERSFVALVGVSGIGKSTLLRILGGLIYPTKGTVNLAGRPVQESNQSIGIVFQKDNLFPWRTAWQNIALPLELQQRSPAEIEQRVGDMIRLVDLEGADDQYPAQLSGGMAQRVALGRALIHEPDLLLLDEPFGALDALTREKMGQELMRIWQARPVTVVMVTHSIPEAVFLADAVLVMNGANGTNQYPASISRHIPIDLPRPRDLAVQKSSSFLGCADEIREALAK